MEHGKIDPAVGQQVKFSAALARLGLGLGILTALVAVLSGAGSRFGWWPFRTGFTLLAGAVCIGIVAAVVSLFAAVNAVKARANRPFALALLGLALGVTAAALPGWQSYVARTVPAIHDITTDTENPPVFVVLATVRAASPNGAAYGGAEVAVAQQAAYPDIKPAQFALPPDRVFEASLATARDMGWEIAAAELKDGRIEATATTLWFGFKDDIVIQIRPEPAGTRLDIRSASRVGKSDVGANARRIRAFLARVRNRLSA